MALALALAGTVTYLVYRRLRVATARPALTQVVASAKDIPPGVALTAEDVRMQDWPANVPLPGSFTKVEQVVGRPSIYPVGPGEPILERDLAVPGSGIGLSVKIPEGMRATAVRSNEVTGVAGFLYPGSHVDALGTFTLPGSPGPVTQTILQDVEVVTAGEKIEPDPQGKPQTVNVVTLLLNPDDSQKILLASTQGPIQFVLRSGADQGKVTLSPTRLEQLVASVKPPAPPVRTIKRTAPPPPRPPEVYLIEVIEGDKRSVEKF